MWRRTDDKFFGDFVFRESKRKDEIAASYYVNCESAIELTDKHIGGYKLKELTPNIIQQYYDKLDRAGLYYNEQDNSGILQLDAQISILKGKLKRILTEIKDE